jgi:hypothetical protein
LTDEVQKKPVQWYLKYEENEFLAFEQIERTTTLYKCDEEFDSVAQYRVIEPLGMAPALLLVDNTDDDGVDSVSTAAATSSSTTPLLTKQERLTWPPLKSRINYYRERVITSFQLVLTHVALKLNSGDLDLDKWRRLLPNMKPKVFVKPAEYYEKK